MLATLSTRLPRDEEAWAYEIKWDGVRAIAYSEAGHLRLESRNLREITSHYPELRALGRRAGAPPTRSSTARSSPSTTAAGPASSGSRAA